MDGNLVKHENTTIVTGYIHEDQIGSTKCLCIVTNRRNDPALVMEIYCISTISKIFLTNRDLYIYSPLQIQQCLFCKLQIPQTNERV